MSSESVSYAAESILLRERLRTKAWEASSGNLTTFLEGAQKKKDEYQVEMEHLTTRLNELKHQKDSLDVCIRFASGLISPSPTMTLPPEILTLIFSNISSNTHPDVEYLETLPNGFDTDVLAASHVCLYWRRVALSTASLWSIISMNLDNTVPCIIDRLLPMYVLRAKQSNVLHLNIYNTNAPNPTALHQHRALTAYLYQVRQCVTSLTLYGQDPLPTGMQMLPVQWWRDFDFQRLQILRFHALCTSRGYGGDSQCTWLRGPGPDVLKLDLTNFSSVVGEFQSISFFRVGSATIRDKTPIDALNSISLLNYGLTFLDVTLDDGHIPNLVPAILDHLYPKPPTTCHLTHLCVRESELLSRTSPDSRGIPLAQFVNSFNTPSLERLQLHCAAGNSLHTDTFPDFLEKWSRRGGQLRELVLDGVLLDTEHMLAWTSVFTSIWSLSVTEPANTMLWSDPSIAGPAFLDSFPHTLGKLQIGFRNPAWAELCVREIPKRQLLRHTTIVLHCQLPGNQVAELRKLTSKKLDIYRAPT